MKKLKIITAAIAVILSMALLIIRFQYRDSASMERKEFSVQGIENGIAIESGGILDGVFISIPDSLEADEIISVSSDTGIAYLVLDSENAGENKVIEASVMAVGEGIAEMYVRSADGSVISDKFTVNVIASENAHSSADTAQTEKVIYDGTTVYVTPSGTRYHLRQSCAGKNGEPIPLESAVTAGYEPCKSCALTK